MLPNNIESIHIEKALAEIDQKGVQNGAQSTTYDLIYNGKRYPPKLVLSLANKFANGVELDRLSFSGGKNTEAFKILREKGFHIESKVSLQYIIQEFLKQAETGNLKKKHYPSKYRGLDVSISFGAGNPARIPWVAFLKPPNKVMDGIYPGILYYKEQDLLVITYGKSETNTSAYSWNVTDAETIDDYFQRRWNSKPDRYGKSLIKAVFETNVDVDYERLEEELDELIDTYKLLSFDENKVNEPTTAYKKNLKQYWLYAPGEGGENWDEFFEKGIMALGWDFIGDLKNFNSKEEIIKALQSEEGTESSKKNDASACDDFLNKMQIGDIVIVKRGVFELLGYGEITSDYYYNENRTSFKKLRNVDWKKKGNWPTGFRLVSKTLTDISNYKSESKFEFYYQYLLSIINGAIDSNQFLKDEQEFKDVVSLYNKNEIDKYFTFLDEILTEINISETDERIAFSCARNNLSLTVGQRPSWRLTNKKGYKYFANADTKLTEDAENFNGKRGHFLNRFKDIELNDEQREAIIRTTKIELSRTNRTGFARHNNLAFEKAAFNKDYRNQILNYKGMEQTYLDNQTPFSLNTILYGPPGTGKTYCLQKKYFDRFTVSESTLTKEQFLENLVIDLTWWQTFAIALKDLGTVSTTVLLDHPIVKAKESLSNAKNIKPIVWSRLQAHAVEECPNVKVSKRSDPQIFYKEENSTWRVIHDTLAELYPEANNLIDKINNYIPSSTKEIKNYEFVTFHQSFSYEDFIEGIKPNLDDQENEISYEIQDGIFKKLCLKADADRANDYAVFIDEINRGNVSAIFGELITLIEKDKRLGEENELKAKLPYSKKELGVPPNLYIFGTMNTADRSVEALDTALRRRFAFEEVMPLPGLLKGKEFDGFNLSELLTVINQRIEALLDRDHTIGHSYFMKIQSGDTKALKHAFENKVIPLLQEYFYHDYEKIALILGEGFVAHKEANVNFAKFKNVDQPELSASFELKQITDIEEAIQILLNRKDEESE
jgi:hypothetical protein